MEQLHSYLWTESIPLVGMLAFVAMMEIGILTFIVAKRFFKFSIPRWLNNPFLLVLSLGLIVYIAKTPIGSTLLFGTTVVLFALFVMIVYFYGSSKKFNAWLNNEQQESNAC